MKKNVLFLICLMAILITGVSACGHKSTYVEQIPEPVPVVEIDTTYAGLIIYYPPTDTIELRCFDRPDPAVDSSIVFCCAAAFTADWGTAPSHDRIQGDHVSRGQFYQRPALKRNTGAFRAWDSSWSFDYDANADSEMIRTWFKSNAIDGGAAFRQEMMIHKSQMVRTTRPFSNVNQFRALCQMGKRLCIADSAQAISFGEFIQLLLNAGVDEALYMDMGPGWNYSWYREYAGGEATYIHSATLGSATNWLVFHKL